MKTLARPFWKHLLTQVGVLLLCCCGVAFGQTPQASLQLSGSNAALCLHNNTEWSISKSASVSEAMNGDSVTWTIDAVRGETSENDLTVGGFVSIKNGGAGQATIGNIVINLQKKVGTKWVSAAANVADATNGDAATVAKIVAAASQEVTNGVNYVKSVPTGTFTETAASGSIEFTDADGNTIWAISPQQTIGANATVNLLFEAHFNNTLLAIPSGQQVRVEVIVTFGNAGARGGSGATAKNIDINGNGSIDVDEANVRSVPTRITKNVPALERCNDSVLLSDVFSTTGTASYDVDYSDIAEAGQMINDSGTYVIETTVYSGEDGGIITNTARLTGESDEIGVIIGYDYTNPLSPEPIYYYFTCCEGANEVATAQVKVETDTGFKDNDFVTYSQGGYSGPGQPGQYLVANFATLFPNGLTIGIEDGLGPKHDATWTSVTALQEFLAGGGPSGALTADTLNATSVSGGALAKQTAALTINIAIDDGLIPSLGSDPVKFGDLVIGGTGTFADGLTVREVLDVANDALGGNGLPGGTSYSNVQEIVEALNLSFHEGEPSAWAQLYLSKP